MRLHEIIQGGDEERCYWVACHMCPMDKEPWPCSYGGKTWATAGQCSQCLADYLQGRQPKGSDGITML